MGHDRQWETVFEARNYAQAGMVKGLLEAEGMPVTLRSLLGVPHLGASAHISVLVPGDQAVRGREIVSAYLRHAPARRCYHRNAACHGLSVGVGKAFEDPGRIGEHRGFAKDVRHHSIGNVRQKC